MWRSMIRLVVTANVVPTSPILLTQMMQAIRSSEKFGSYEPHAVTSQKTAFFCCIFICEAIYVEHSDGLLHETWHTWERRLTIEMESETKHRVSCQGKNNCRLVAASVHTSADFCEDVAKNFEKYTLWNNL
jgi:hypothetical protein